MVEKRVQVYRTDRITVTFAPDACVHSAECLRTLPEVFDVSRKRWIRPDLSTPEKVAAAVRRCPSGALQYSLEGTAPAGPRAEVKAAVIRLSQDGPLLLDGAVRIESESGEAVDLGGRSALCRCGATGNQPFCDGSHKRVGFRSRR